MKKYIVCRGFKIFNPSVSEQFDDLDLACQYRDVMRANNPDSNFEVYERIN